MRNGDFIPTRLQAQQDAVNAVCHMKTRQNQENSVGLLSLAEYVRVCVLEVGSVRVWAVCIGSVNT